MEAPIKIKKINRTLICNTTGKEIIVKPDKFAKMVEYHGSEKKAIENFICYEAEKQSRNPELLFWLQNSVEFKSFKEELLRYLKLFNDSSRTQEDVLLMQKSATDLLSRLNIPNYEFVTQRDSKGGYVSALKLKSIPFSNGEIIINYD